MELTSCIGNVRCFGLNSSQAYVEDKLHQEILFFDPTHEWQLTFSFTTQWNLFKFYCF